ncbi:MAG: SDR family oxidoreductase [Actinomycetota bacterium]|nr:SDR family oxidoreductase [Actinomycetota bacterium]
MGRLDGKTALVTGAARGSGAVIAERFTEEGAHVVVADIREEQGRAVAEKVGGRYVTLDVTSESSWAEAVGALDALDVLVNNAGVLHLTAIADTTVETYRHVFEVNELGTFLGIKSSIEPMKARGGGSIVNISSIDGVYVTPGTAAYSASKFAVRGLTKTAALELGRFNIRVNAVCPAAGNIEMVMEALPPDFDFGRAASGGGGDAHRAPIGKRGTMRDVADAALYFASDEAAFVTGADLLVDGGLSAGMVIPGQPGT